MLVAAHTLFGAEALFVCQVGVGVNTLLLGEVQRVHYHVVVQHFGLVDAVHGVELVLPLCGQICSPLVALPSLLGAPEDHYHNQDHKWNQSGEGGNQGHLAAIHFLGYTFEGEDGAIGQDIAVLARVARKALAFKVIQLVDTKAVHARGSGTLVHLLTTVFAGEARLARTNEVVDGIVASSTVGTGVGEAVIDILLAVPSHEAGVTIALVVVDKVKAGATVRAWVASTVINVDLTVAAGEAGGTTALVLFSRDQCTGTAILARGRAAMVNLHIAVHTLELWVTFALISAVHGVGTGSTVLTGVVGTRLGTHLAVDPVEAKRTDTHIIILSSTLKKKQKRNF